MSSRLGGIIPVTVAAIGVTICAGIAVARFHRPKPMVHMPGVLPKVSQASRGPSKATRAALVPAARPAGSQPDEPELRSKWIHNVALRGRRGRFDIGLGAIDYGSEELVPEEPLEEIRIYQRTPGGMRVLTSTNVDLSLPVYDFGLVHDDRDGVDFLFADWRSQYGTTSVWRIDPHDLRPVEVLKASAADTGRLDQGRAREWLPGHYFGHPGASARRRWRYSRRARRFLAGKWHFQSEHPPGGSPDDPWW